MDRFKVTKTILWALNPPNPGEYSLVEGTIVDDVPEHIIKPLLEIGYIKQIEKEFTVDIQAQLNDIAAQAPNKLEAKNALEEWGIVNLNYNIDKRKSLKNIIAELVAKHESKRKKMINAWENKESCPMISIA